MTPGRVRFLGACLGGLLLVSVACTPSDDETSLAEARELNERISIPAGALEIDEFVSHDDVVTQYAAEPQRLLDISVPDNFARSHEVESLPVGDRAVWVPKRVWLGPSPTGVRRCGVTLETAASRRTNATIPNPDIRAKLAGGNLELAQVTVSCSFAPQGSSP